MCIKMSDLGQKPIPTSVYTCVYVRVCECVSNYVTLTNIVMIVHDNIYIKLCDFSMLIGLLGKRSLERFLDTLQLAEDHWAIR